MLVVTGMQILKCRHSERKEIKTERLSRVAIAAMKQSLKVYLPVINPIVDFEKLVSEHQPEVKFICTMNAGIDEGFKKKYTPGKSLIAIIGPEGDFIPEEVEFAVQHGFKPVSLGTSRLRTETAALTVCTIFNFVNSK